MAAAAGGAAGAAQPAPPAHITVAIFPGDSSYPLEIMANLEVVTSTPFLPWQPVPVAAAGAPATVRLAQYIAVKAFVRRCELGHAQADAAAFQVLDCIRFGLIDVCWGRLLTILRDAGLFAKGPLLSVGRTFVRNEEP